MDGSPIDPQGGSDIQQLFGLKESRYHHDDPKEQRLS